MSAAGPPADPFAAVAWQDAGAWGVEGRGWADVARPFDRLPARSEPLLPEAVWNLSRQPAGLSVRFHTDAPEIYARWGIENNIVPGFPQTPVSIAGLDCYGQSADGRWYWVGQGNPHKFPVSDGRLHRLPLDAAWRQYRVYLPLGRPVPSLEIGVERGYRLAGCPPDPRPPIVIYGTSIVHGAAVSRPGMAHPAILERRLAHPVINLGFSGRARMEPVLAELLGELDAALFVVDCLPNMDGPMIRERLGPFVRTLRGRRPTTPILFVADRLWTDATFVASRRADQVAKSAAQRAEVERLQAAGDAHLHILDHPNLLGDDFDGAADGSHPSDLGSYRMADVLEPVLRRLLAG